MRNHERWRPETFAHLGTVPSARIQELSEVRMSGDVEVPLNRAVVDHDIALVVGPGRFRTRLSAKSGGTRPLPGRRRTEDHRHIALATGMPEEACRAVNLGHRDPATVDVSAFAADRDTLVVPRAGEVLFRLR